MAQSWCHQSNHGPHLLAGEEALGADPTATADLLSRKIIIGIVGDVK
jgi:hypothetical protein